MAHELSSPARPSDLHHALSWRYATKKFDPARRIDPATWAVLEESLHQAPSSFGLQPWRFVVVEDRTLRSKLRALSWNQSQIEDASHLVVCARRSPLVHGDILAHIQRMSEVRNVPSSEFAGLQKAIEGFVGQPGFDAESWSARQVYIALGFFLSAAAFLGVDACPMEGIDPAGYDALLGLPAEGYRTTVVVTAGFRAKEDGYAVAAKVRFPRDRVIIRR